MIKVKQVLRALVLATFIFTSFSVSAQENNFNTNKTKINVDVDIEWGRKSRDCRGFGICFIDFSIDIETQNNKVNNTLSFFLENNVEKLSIFIPKNNATKELKGTQFNKNRFIIIDENITISNTKFLNKGLRKSSYIIKKGQYLVKRTKNGYVIKL